MTSLPGPVASSGARGLSRRIAAFAGVPMLSLLAPLLFLPVLARMADADSWVAIALGQSVGGFAALIGSLGYATLAPPLVAVASSAERRRILATSMHVRVPAWIVLAIASAIVAALFAPASARAEAAMMAVAMSLAALAPTWFWIGVGRVKPIVWLEVVPRMTASILAAGILLVGGTVMWYPALLVLAMVIAPVVVSWRYVGRELFRVDKEEITDIARRHPPGLIAETAAGAYNALAVTVVTATASLSQAAQFVSGDKAYRIGQYSVTALGNALQGWVVQAGPQFFGRRLKIVIGLHSTLGLVGMVLAGLFGSWLTRVLFSADVAITPTTAWGFGVALLGISLGTACGRIGLISIGARNAFMVCVVAASAVGFVALMVGATRGGAAGAAWGLGLTELTSGVAQGVVLAVLLRRRGRARSTTEVEDARGAL